VSVMREEGFSSRQIASRVGCSQSAVIKILHKKKETGSVVDKARSGRPRASTSRQDRTLRRISLANRKLTSPQLLRQWWEKCNVTVSSSTVRRRCLNFGLRGCKARRKPLMTDVQRRNRIQWARQYSSWTCEMWKKVLFSDESTFCLFGNQSHTYVRRFRGEEFKPECLNLTVKHPLKITVWGCMAASGVGRLHIVDGTVNTTKYITILHKCILPSARDSFSQISSCSRMTMHHAVVPNWSLTGNTRTTLRCWTGQPNLRI